MGGSVSKALDVGHHMAGYMRKLWHASWGSRMLFVFLVFSVGMGWWNYAHRPISLNQALFTLIGMSVLGLLAFACRGWAITHPRKK